MAIRLIRCVENFDPDKATRHAHIYSQLKYELLNFKAPLKRTGITGLPYNSRWNDILSLDTISEGNCAFAVA